MCLNCSLLCCFAVLVDFAVAVLFGDLVGLLGCLFGLLVAL